MHMDFRYFPQSMQDDSRAVSELLALNVKSEDFGLSLTKEEALMIAAAENEAMDSRRRIRFGKSAAPLLLERFMHSSFISRDIWAETAAELLEIFCDVKEESCDLLSDEEIADIMYDFFENTSCGSTELLGSRDMELLCRAVRMRAYGIRGEE